MTAKALIRTDLDIALLREQIKEGRADSAAFERLKMLLQRRNELLSKMLAERSREMSFA